MARATPGHRAPRRRPPLPVRARPLAGGGAVRRGSLVRADPAGHIGRDDSRGADGRIHRAHRRRDDALRPGRLASQWRAVRGAPRLARPHRSCRPTVGEPGPLRRLWGGMLAGSVHRLPGVRDRGRRWRAPRGAALVVPRSDRARPAGLVRCRLHRARPGRRHVRRDAGDRVRGRIARRAADADHRCAWPDVARLPPDRYGRVRPRRRCVRPRVLRRRWR